jgi:hypothetical protein
MWIREKANSKGLVSFFTLIIKNPEGSSMNNRKHLFSFILIIGLLSLIFSGCSGNSSIQSVTFSQLISQADKYNGKTVTLEAFYFSGFEISALSESLAPSTSGIWRIPKGTLIWVEGGIS